MSFRTLGIFWIVIAFVFVIVEQPFLALLFGVLGILAILGKMEQPKKAAAPAAKKPAPVKKTSPEPTASKSANRQNSLKPATAPDAYAFHGTVEQYFRNLLETKFPDYQVAQNAPLTAGASQTAGWTCSCGIYNTGKFCAECGSSKPAESTDWICSCGQKNTGKFCPECGKSKPVLQAVVAPVGNTALLTFLLSKNGSPKLGIVLCDKHDWNNEHILASMAACKSANIPCLRFMRQFRNDVDYVTDRIRKSLR